MSAASSGGSGVGCLTILGLIFVGLKLAGIGAVASWSWWWVLSPFLVNFALVAALLVVVLIGAAIAAGIAIFGSKS